MGPAEDYTLRVMDEDSNQLGLLSTEPFDKCVVLEFEPSDRNDYLFLVGLTPRQARKLAKRLTKQADIIEGNK